MNQEKIGKFICKLRKEKKLTQGDLASLLGVSEKSVSNWENGILLFNWHSNYFCVNTTVYTSFPFKIRNYDLKMFICIYKK